MNPDTLDRRGRAASEALHAELADLDTDAALASIHAGEAPAPVRTVRARRRWMAAAAAAIAVVGATVGTLEALGDRGDDAEPVDTAAAPSALDPTDYGPVIGRLVSPESPTLVAEVHGPEPLGAADEVEVTIEGAVPGQAYAITQCLRADVSEVHPGVGCSDGFQIEVGPDGRGLGVLRLPAVFVGSQPLRHNDCRVEACDLMVTPVIEDDQPDGGQAGTRFTSPADRWPDEGATSPWIPLSYDADAEVGPLPSLSASAVAGRPGDGHRLRIEGQDLAPGPVELVVVGYAVEPDVPLMALASSASQPLADLQVGPDGTLAIEVDVPDQLVSDIVMADETGQVASPELISCAEAPWACQIRLTWRAVYTPEGGPSPLLPEPVAYPG